MTQNSTDSITPSDRWQFDEEVTQVFDDMLRRSIPQYELMRSSTVDIVKRFATQGGTILDLGCSRGELIERLFQELGGYCQYIGVEVSEAMLKVCRERFAHRHDVIKIESLDLRVQYPPIYNACAVISCLTLQFTPIEYRQRLIQQIYQSLLPGGAFIFIEKVLGATAEIDRLMTDLYYQMKGDNGYSKLDIERKRLSLEGVLVPVTAAWNADLLKQAGFKEVDCFWRWMNFAGWVAIK